VDKRRIRQGKNTREGGLFFWGVIFSYWRRKEKGGGVERLYLLLLVLCLLEELA
jgi:hypothetical protein